MQSMQKAVQLTTCTFCVKSEEKYKCSFFQKNAIVLSICDMPCIYGRSKKLILPDYFNKEIEFAMV